MVDRKEERMSVTCFKALFQNLPSRSEEGREHLQLK